MVRSMRCRDGVAAAKVRADTGRDRLLTGGQVHLSRNQALADVEARPLVRVVLAKDRFLEGADQHHRAVEPEPYLRIECAGGARLDCHGASPPVASAFPALWAGTPPAHKRRYFRW